MSDKLTNIEVSFQDDDDLLIIEQQYDQVHFIFLGLNTLIDFPSTMQDIEKLILTASLNDEIPLLIENLGDRVEKLHHIQSEILEGNLIIHLPLNETFISINPIPRTLERAIEPPAEEDVLSGPKSSFNEDLFTNLGLVRKQLITKQFTVKNFTIGKEQTKQLSLLYLNETTNVKLVHSVISQIKRNQNKHVHTVQDMMRILGFSTWSIIPKFHMTELPQEASQALLKGKVVLMIDRMPFAFILPSLLSDMIFLENDKNLLYPFMLLVRFLRIIGILVAIFIPGLYVALVAVNPEVLRIELALSIAQSREGVPYPALVEVLLMLLVLELILEASVRLPKSIGPTITMVGGIILGQAVVDAKLVSNLLIIILAATMIANATVIGFQNSISIRILKYIVVILASIYGILGIWAGIFIICSYLASIQTFNIPYIKLNLAKDDSSSE